MVVAGRRTEQDHTKLFINKSWTGYGRRSVTVDGRVDDEDQEDEDLRTLSVPPSYIYGTPYLGSAGGSTGAGTASGLVPIPATQLSHAAAIAAATSQFYEYQQPQRPTQANIVPDSTHIRTDLEHQLEQPPLQHSIWQRPIHTRRCLRQEQQQLRPLRRLARAFLGWLQLNHTNGLLTSKPPNKELTFYHTNNKPADETQLTSVYDRKLLELYYLVQIVRSYRRPAYQEPTVVLSNLIDRLTKEELREQLERMLVGVDGFEEIFNIGLHQTDSDERDPVKEQLANDFRLLFPIVVRTLTGLRDADDGAGFGKSLTDNEVHSKIQEALNDFRNLLMSAEQWEDSASVFEELNLQQKLTLDIVPPEAVNNIDEKKTVLEETVLVTEMPVASNKLIVNDYDLDVNYPEDNTSELGLPMAVSVKDPEILAIIPVIVEQLRQDNITAEEEETLAGVFAELWPLMKAEAYCLRHAE
uniref:Uncharacterized protein n=1 Tax=Anopheles albimanus TaxID=7167 RepID=A0A182FB93_ANOAL